MSDSPKIVSDSKIAILYMWNNFSRMNTGKSLIRDSRATKATLSSPSSSMYLDFQRRCLLSRTLILDNVSYIILIKIQWIFLFIYLSIG